MKCGLIQHIRLFCTLLTLLLGAMKIWLRQLFAFLQIDPRCSRGGHPPLHLKETTVTKRKRPDSRQLDLIEWSKTDHPITEAQLEAVRSALAVSGSPRTWRGQMIVPPGSLLDRVVELFERTTDFPLEMPAFFTLHALAAYLLDKRVHISVAGTMVLPDLWTVILGASCTGKSFTLGVINKVMPLRMMPETTSSARFMEELALNNHGALFQDEWAQYIKRMDGQSYAEEMKEYLLRLYDNKPIARRTAKATIEIDDPALVIVGTTVEETFLKNVSLESMLDGFSQRFQYVIGRADPERTTDMFPIYRTMEPANLLPIQQAWAAMERVPLHPQYLVDQAGEQEFVEAFRRLFGHYASMPASFFRRVMWRTFKYALVYHLLLGKHNDTIDAEDV
jgi:hypothetical protein